MTKYKLMILDAETGDVHCVSPVFTINLPIGDVRTALHLVFLVVKLLMFVRNPRLWGRWSAVGSRVQLNVVRVP